MLKKEDPRALRTKTMFKEAVLLLLKDGITPNQLTIQKVAKQAGLNRSTFYLHYKDIYDLQEQLQLEIIEALTNKVEALAFTEDLTHETKLVHLLDYLYTIKIELSILFQSGQLEIKLLNLIKELIHCRRELLEPINLNSSINPEIRAASLVGIIMWWLKTDTNYSSAYIAQQINQMYK